MTLEYKYYVLKIALSVMDSQSVWNDIYILILPMKLDFVIKIRNDKSSYNQCSSAIINYKHWY